MTSSFDRALFVMLAVLWLIIGAASRTTPPGPTVLWVASSTLASATAAAVAVHWSRHALRAYLSAVAVIGIARAIAYLTIGAYNPFAVWAVMIATTIIVYARESDLVTS